MDADAKEEKRQPIPKEPNPYDETGHLTREGMVQIIRNGGSVLYGSALIWREEDIPSEAQLAKGDARKSVQAAKHIDEQIAELQKQKALLKNDTELHAGDKDVPYTSAPDLPGVKVGEELGEGDTAGLAHVEDPVGQVEEARQAAAARAKLGAVPGAQTRKPEKPS